MNKIHVIGVAGGSASGKTTIVKKIQEYFGEDIVVLGHDSYYKAHDDMDYEARSRLNYDHPNAFDTERMVEDVRKLIRGQAVDIPVYDYTIHNRSEQTEHIEPKKLIIIEGFLIMENKELRELMDAKIFVDADADERLMRRIRRDTVERARSVTSILDQYEATVKPMYEAFVEPSKRYADVIIPRGGENTIGITMLKEYLKHLLAK
ncbi:MAG: uridine kinase [Eubacterium sp.]|nr:uridine kinase [Eubacterium sp.]